MSEHSMRTVTPEQPLLLHADRSCSELDADGEPPIAIAASLHGRTLQAPSIESVYSADEAAGDVQGTAAVGRFAPSTLAEHGMLHDGEDGVGSSPTLQSEGAPAVVLAVGSVVIHYVPYFLLVAAAMQPTVFGLLYLACFIIFVIGIEREDVTPSRWWNHEHLGSASKRRMRRVMTLAVVAVTAVAAISTVIAHQILCRDNRSVISRDTQYWKIAGLHDDCTAIRALAGCWSHITAILCAALGIAFLRWEEKEPLDAAVPKPVGPAALTPSACIYSALRNVEYEWAIAVLACLAAALRRCILSVPFLLFFIVFAGWRMIVATSASSRKQLRGDIIVRIFIGYLVFTLFAYFACAVFVADGGERMPDSHMLWKIEGFVTAYQEAFVDDRVYLVYLGAFLNVLCVSRLAAGDRDSSRPHDHGGQASVLSRGTGAAVLLAFFRFRTLVNGMLLFITLNVTASCVGVVWLLLWAWCVAMHPSQRFAQTIVVVGLAHLLLIFTGGFDEIARKASRSTMEIIGFKSRNVADGWLSIVVLVTTVFNLFVVIIYEAAVLTLQEGSRHQATESGPVGDPAEAAWHLPVDYAQDAEPADSHSPRRLSSVAEQREARKGTVLGRFTTWSSSLKDDLIIGIRHYFHVAAFFALFVAAVVQVNVLHSIFLVMFVFVVLQRRFPTFLWLLLVAYTTSITIAMYLVIVIHPRDSATLETIGFISPSRSTWSITPYLAWSAVFIVQLRIAQSLTAGEAAGQLSKFARYLETIEKISRSTIVTANMAFFLLICSAQQASIFGAVYLFFFLFTSTLVLATSFHSPPRALRQLWTLVIIVVSVMVFCVYSYQLSPELAERVLDAVFQPLTTEVVGVTVAQRSQRRSIVTLWPKIVSLMLCIVQWRQWMTVVSEEAAAESSLRAAGSSVQQGSIGALIRLFQRLGASVLNLVSVYSQVLATAFLFVGALFRLSGSESLGSVSLVQLSFYMNGCLCSIFPQVRGTTLFWCIIQGYSLIITAAQYALQIPVWTDYMRQQDWLPYAGFAVMTSGDEMMWSTLFPSVMVFATAAIHANAQRHLKERVTKPSVQPSARGAAEHRHHQYHSSATTLPTEATALLLDSSSRRRPVVHEVQTFGTRTEEVGETVPLLSRSECASPAVMLPQPPPPPPPLHPAQSNQGDGHHNHHQQGALFGSDTPRRTLQRRTTTMRSMRNLLGSATASVSRTIGGVYERVINPVGFMRFVGFHLTLGSMFVTSVVESSTFLGPLYFTITVAAAHFGREQMLRSYRWTAIALICFTTMTFQYALLLSMPPGTKARLVPPEAELESYFSLRPSPWRVAFCVVSWCFVVLEQAALSQHPSYVFLKGRTDESPALTMSERLEKMQARIQLARQYNAVSLLERLIPEPTDRPNFTKCPRLLSRLRTRLQLFSPLAVLTLVAVYSIYDATTNLVIAKMLSLFITLIFFQNSRGLTWRGNKWWKWILRFHVLWMAMRLVYFVPRIQCNEQATCIFAWIGVVPNVSMLRYRASWCSPADGGDEPFSCVVHRYGAQDLAFHCVILALLWLQSISFHRKEYAFLLHHRHRADIAAMELGEQLRISRLVAIRARKQAHSEYVQTQLVILQQEVDEHEPGSPRDGAPPQQRDAASRGRSGLGLLRRHRSHTRGGGAAQRAAMGDDDPLGATVKSIDSRTIGILAGFDDSESDSCDDEASGGGDVAHFHATPQLTSSTLTPAISLEPSRWERPKDDALAASRGPSIVTFAPLAATNNNTPINSREVSPEVEEVRVSAPFPSAPAVDERDAGGEREPTIADLLGQAVDTFILWLDRRSLHLGEAPRLKRRSIAATGRIMLLAKCMYAFLFSYTDRVCYLMFSIQFLLSPSLLSALLPISATTYAVPMNPRPHRGYWSLSLIYLQLMIAVKSVIKVAYCGDPNPQPMIASDDAQQIDVVNIWHGRTCLHDFYLIDALMELLCVLSVLLHMHRLRTWGLWDDSELDMAANEREAAALAAMSGGLRGSVSAAQDQTILAGKSTLSTMARVALVKLRSAFKNISRSEIKTGADLYRIAFAFELVSFTYVFFEYYRLSGTEETLVDSLRHSILPGGLAVTLILLFAFMSLDRVVYIIRSTVLKYVINTFFTIFYHAVTIWWFNMQVRFVFNYYRDTSFGVRGLLGVASVIYLLKSCYLFLGSVQVSRGMPEYAKHIVYAGSYSNFEFYAYYFGRLVPFLYDTRVILDWTVARTSLKLPYWMKLEDICHELYVLQCDKVDTAVIDKMNGFDNKRQYPPIFKYPIGISCFLLLTAILMFPLLLYSSFSPVLQDNSVLSLTATVAIEGAPPLWQSSNRIIKSAASFNSHNGRLNDTVTNLLEHTRPSLVGLGLSTDETQLLTLSNYSSTMWSISPPARQLMIENLNGTQELNLAIDVQIRSKVAGSNSPTSFLTQQHALSADDKRNLTELLLGNVSTVKLPRLYSPFLFNKPQNDFSSLSRQDGPNMIDCFIGAIGTENAMYFSLWCRTLFMRSNPSVEHPWNNLSPAEKTCLRVSACPNYETESQHDFAEAAMYFVIVSTPVLSASFLQSIGIVAAYTTFVFAVGRVLRFAVSGGAFRTHLEDLEDPQYLVNLIELMFVARSRGQFDLEKRAYLRLVETLRASEELERMTCIGGKVKRD